MCSDSRRGAPCPHLGTVHAKEAQLHASLLHHCRSRKVLAAGVGLTLSWLLVDISMLFI